MIKIENTVTPSPMQWERIILGARNAMNSWDRMDSKFYVYCSDCDKDDYCTDCESEGGVALGKKDRELLTRLAKAGTDHRKFMRMIAVYVDITAPLYWWKEFDTYKVGTVANSCSTMHRIAEKEFTVGDFSCEHLIDEKDGWVRDEKGQLWCSARTHMETTVNLLNAYRYQYLETKDKKYWWQMIQLLPTSYNQKRTVMLNYEVLANIYKSRKNHKLDEWHDFCDWIKALPYSELITGEDNGTSDI